VLPVLTFFAIGVSGWFGPSSLYPNPNDHICATNAAPVGQSVLLYYDRTRRGIVCRVVGQVTQKANLVDVSRSVRDALGFRGETTLRVYRIIGKIGPCPNLQPDPKNCKNPPSVCMANLPQPSLVLCI
jgi:hypothetical protein